MNTRFGKNLRRKKPVYWCLTRSLGLAKHDDGHQKKPVLVFVRHNKRPLGKDASGLKEAGHVP